MFWRSFLMILMAVLSLAGCSGSGGAASVERRERNSSLYRAAISAEQAGDLDQAVELYTKLLNEDPKAVSAHFQLALLLQDHKRDYLGAIHHYRTYLRLRPESEKSGGGVDRDALIVQRIARAKAQLAPQLLEELGDSVDSVSQAKLMKANGELEDRLKEAATAQQRLTRERDDAIEKIKTLEGETARLRKLVEDLRGAEVVVANPAAVRADKPQPEKDLPESDAAAKRALLDKFRLDAEKESAASRKGGSLRELVEKETKPENRSGESEASRIIREALADGTLTEDQVKPAAPATPEPPKPVVKREDTKDALNALLGRGKNAKTEKRSEAGKAVGKYYVVQPGDTLFRVAEKFYGDSTQWKRIRDANRTRIDPDGRIRAGQRILIP